MSEIKKVAFLCLAFILLYNLFFFKVILGLGFGVIILLINLYFFLIRNKEDKNFTSAVFCSLISSIFAFLFAFRGNEVVKLVDFIASFFFLLVSLYLYKSKQPFSHKLSNFVGIPFETVFSSIKSFFSFFGKTPEQSATPKATKMPIIRGILISVPIFLLLLYLLVQADPIFGKLTGDFFSSIKERTLASLVIFFVLFSLGLTEIKNRILGKENSNEISVGKSHELYIILGSIAVLFSAFIVVQFKYLFFSASEGELAQLGIKSLTFSEYVNKGFFELLIASSIVSAVIMYVLRFVYKLKGLEKLFIQLLSGLVTFETGFILLSDARRLSLYADAHGLTRARVFGFIFLVWLALFLIILVFRIIEDLSAKRFLTSFLAISLLAIFSVNFINIDGLIADQYKPTVNGEVDYYYLTSLSTDGVSSWSSALVEVGSQLRALEQVKDISTEDSRKIYWAKHTLEQLVYKLRYLDNRYNSSFKWQAFNYSEYLAYKTITSTDIFKSLPSLLYEANMIDSRISDNVRQNTPIDRSTNPPLTR